MKATRLVIAGFLWLPLLPVFARDPATQRITEPTTQPTTQPATDLDLLQGRWTCTSVIYRGKPAPEEVMKQHPVFIDVSGVTLVMDEATTPERHTRNELVV